MRFCSGNVPSQGHRQLRRSCKVRLARQLEAAIPTPATLGWPLQAGAPAGPADRAGNSLAMGHSPEQIAGRLALEHGRVIISHEVILESVFHSSSARPRRIAADCPPPRRKRRRGRRPGRSPASLINGRSITRTPSQVEGRGLPGHWEADFMLLLDARRGVAGSPRTDNTRFSVSLQHPLDRKCCPHCPDYRSSTRQTSTGDNAKPSASTTETSSPSITGFTKFPRRPNPSAIPIVPGKKGGVAKLRPAPFQKIFRFAVGQISSTSSPCPFPARGALRGRHERGMGCGGRGSVGAHGDRRASKTRERFTARTRTALTRTAKSCGPDTRCWCQVERRRSQLNRA